MDRNGGENGLYIPPNWSNDGREYSPPSVRFSTRLNVKLVPSLSDLADSSVIDSLWNTPDDMQRIESDIIQSIRTFRQNRYVDENEHTMRGLEHLRTPEDLLRRKEVKNSALAVVLGKKRRHRRRGDEIDESGDRVAAAYGAAAASARDLAFERGAEDAAYVQEHVIQHFRFPRRASNPYYGAASSREELFPQRAQRRASTGGGMLARLNDRGLLFGGWNNRRRGSGGTNEQVIDVPNSALDFTESPDSGVAAMAVPARMR